MTLIYLGRHSSVWNVLYTEPDKFILSSVDKGTNTVSAHQKLEVCNQQNVPQQNASKFALFYVYKHTHVVFTFLPHEFPCLC